MTLDQQAFFDKLNTELSKIITALAEKKDLKDTEEKIQKILEGWPHEAGTDQMVWNICSIVLSFILLNRQKYIDALGRNPSNFITDFFKRIIPPSFCSPDIIDNEFSKIFSKVQSEQWVRIASPLRPQITIVLWEMLDSPEEDTSLRKSVLNIKDIEKGRVTIYEKFLPGTYEQYISDIDKRLRFGISESDLVLIDSVLLAEYKSKGVFDTVYYYLRDELDEREGKLTELEIGKTDNGLIEAIPITRNFHMPGHGKDYASDGPDICNKNRKFSDIAVLSEQIPKNINDKWVKLRGGKAKLLFSNPGRSSTSNAQDNISIVFEQFITFMGREIPFVPMQAARGAHMAYTFFAYLSCTSIKQPSFIALDEEYRRKNGGISIKVLHPQLLKNRINHFLQFVYSFVPVSSLCLEHILAAALRTHRSFKSIWFDPCLPIEAQKFQMEEIKFGERPLQTGSDDSSLSCLGGYCLALDHKADVKHSVAKIGLNLATNYFEQANRIAKEYENQLDKWPKDYNCRINYVKDSTVSGYLDTPKCIAKRPSFYGWKVIEELISNTVRQYMVTVMLVRAITDEAARLDNDYDEKDEQRQLLEQSYYNKHIPEFGTLDHVMKEYIEKNAIISEDSIQKYLLSAKTIIKKFFLENTDVASKVSSMEALIDSNFDCLIEDRNAILGLLRSGIEQIQVEVDVPGTIIEYLSDRMSQSLFTKLSAISHSAGWNFVSITE